MVYPAGLAPQLTASASAIRAIPVSAIWARWRRGSDGTSGEPETSPEVRADAGDGVVGFGHVAGGHLEDVLHLREFVQPDFDTGGAGAVRHPPGVIEKRFVSADLNVQR